MHDQCSWLFNVNSDIGFVQNRGSLGWRGAGGQLVRISLIGIRISGLLLAPVSPLIHTGRGLFLPGRGKWDEQPMHLLSFPLLPEWGDTPPFPNPIHAMDPPSEVFFFLYPSCRSEGSPHGRIPGSSPRYAAAQSGPTGFS